MKKSKKFLAVLLTVCMILTTAVPAFAAEVDAEPMTAPSNVKRIFDPSQADIIRNDLVRGAKKPTQLFNLDGANYYVDGLFDTTIYTSYYFYPNADGELYYSLTFQWEESVGTERSVGVECWDRTTNSLATSNSFSLAKNSNETYGPSVSTGSWRIYNLDSTHQYYFRFTKSFDGIDANVTGTIYT